MLPYIIATLKAYVLGEGVMAFVFWILCEIKKVRFSVDKISYQCNIKLQLLEAHMTDSLNRKVELITAKFGADAEHKASGFAWHFFERGNDSLCQTWQLVSAIVARNQRDQRINA